MPKLSVGDPAPDFTLAGTEGSFTLSEHRGERVVLLFYPGDETSVCTKQMCSYRDRSAEVAALGATLVGISTKDAASKEAFKANHGLTVPLLADADGKVAAAYGLMAKRLRMTKRATVIVDEQGRIAHWHNNFLSLSYDSVDDIKQALQQVPAAA
ncbi:MAG: alkyl hydroperoxide reductase/Thiol specific antioxidant/Mal allergen [Solirubrobacterales bacterium]|jgi:peroxiredoxin Q/BCP|nr:alkyl hydroperoxide reductase/Thiol specific antioxidant/Mal allergen [Solirubrobacterales bacterium]